MVKKPTVRTCVDSHSLLGRNWGSLKQRGFVLLLRSSKAADEAAMVAKPSFSMRYTAASNGEVCITGDNIRR